MTSQDCPNLSAGAHAPGEPTRLNRWIDRGLWVALFLACAMALSPNVADPDLWGHAQYGRDALSEGLPSTTTYSFTAQGYRWINHENLSELVFAIGADTIGSQGLLVFKCLLGVAIIGALVWHMRRKAITDSLHGSLRDGGSGARCDFVTVCVFVLLISVNLTYHWSVRPQIFTFTYYTLLLLLLDYCFAGWQFHCNLPWFRRTFRAEGDAKLEYSIRRLRLLWLAPVLFVVWTNTHGGFVGGLCIFIAYLGLRGFEALCSKGRESLGLLLRLGLMIAASVVATGLNPYSYRLHGWLFESLRTPRPEISEWHSIAITDPHSLPLFLLVVVVVASLWRSRRPLDLTHLGVLAITLWQGVEHQRHIPFFALAVGFWVPRHFDSMLARFRERYAANSTLTAGMSPRMRTAVATGLLLTFALLSYRLYDRMSIMPVERDRFPVGAVQYMADHDITGNLVVTYNWAQYIIAALGPRTAEDDGVRVAFDGRFRTCYPQEVVDMHFDFVLGSGGPIWRWRSPDSGPVDPTKVLRYGNPDLVLINRYQPHSVEVMRHQTADWVLLYQDSLSQLWGKRTKYADPHSDAYLPLAARNITENIQEGEVDWPALPIKRSPPQAIALQRESSQEPKQ